MQDAHSQSAQTRVIDGVRSRIIRGELPPGTALSEGALADEFDVSRTPVREALKQLQTEGLVEIRPRVGTFVTAPTRRSMIELFHMKELIEGSAAGLLAARGDCPELRALRENIRASDVALSAEDRGAYAHLNEEFHELIIRGADNDKLAEHYRIMMNQLAYPRLVHASLEQPGRLAGSVGEHHDVLDMIAAKDAFTAERFMRSHVRASRDALLSIADFPLST